MVRNSCRICKSSENYYRAFIDLDVLKRRQGTTANSPATVAYNRHVRLYVFPHDYY